MIAISGNSGTGKSTLLKLMLRFHDVTSGKIKIGNYDINDLQIESLRNYFNVVPQDAYFFQTTLWENMKMVQPDLLEEKLDYYIEMVGLKDKIDSLPERYNTEMGDRGNFFSGGEKQRLALIRALLCDAPVLVLDESSSQLDAVNEKKLIDLLKYINEKFNKTIIMVAHRLSTISKFDEIVVLESGRAVECGNHQELLDRKGAYYQLWLTDSTNDGKSSNEK